MDQDFILEPHRSSSIVTAPRKSQGMANEKGGTYSTFTLANPDGVASVSSVSTT